MKIDSIEVGVIVTRCDECEYKQNHIEWISVKRMKPLASSEVLIYAPSIGVMIGWFDDKETEWHTEYFTVDDVTHWQPLPMPPQEADNGR